MRGAGPATLALVLATGSSAEAQPLPAGEGAVTVWYERATSSEHLNREGQADRLGSELFHVVFGDVDYGLTDRLTVGGTLVWLGTEWNGPEHLSHGPIDTGEFHYSLQDVRLDARYSADVRSVTVTPFISLGTPTRDYEVRGHSAFGRGLADTQVGVGFGGSVGRAGYLYSSVAYAFVERVDDAPYDMDRINGELEFGHGVGAGLWARGVFTWQIMRDGLELGPQTEHFELREIHDRLARASYTQLGGSLAIPLGGRFELEAGGFGTLTGRNFHKVVAFVSALTWRFGGGLQVVGP